MAKRKRIVLVGPTSPPYGGPEKVTESLLSSKLFNSLYEVHHVNTRKELTNEQRSRLQPVNVAYNVAHFASLVWTIVRRRPQTVFLFVAQNKIAFARDAVFIAAAALLGTRVVASREGSYFREFYAGCSRPFQWFVRKTLGMASCLRVESEMIRSQFDGVVESDRVKVCRTGIDPGPLGELSPRKGSEIFRVLFVGNVSVAKGAVDLVRAATVLKEQYSGRFEIRLAGGFINREQNILGVESADNAETQIRKLVEEHDLSGRVTLCGPVYGADKIDEFARADVFVLPSYSEGLSNALMEAIAAGLPVIATRIGALPECVEEGRNGYLIEPGDWRALGRRLAELAEQPDLRARMGIAGRDLSLQRFGMDAFVECLSTLL